MAENWRQTVAKSVETWRSLVEKNSEWVKCQFCNELIPTLLYTTHDSFCNKRPDKCRENFTTPNSDKRKYIKGEWEIINRVARNI